MSVLSSLGAVCQDLMLAASNYLDPCEVKITKPQHNFLGRGSLKIQKSHCSCKFNPSIIAENGFSLMSRKLTVYASGMLIQTLLSCRDVKAESCRGKQQSSPSRI